MHARKTRKYPLFINISAPQVILFSKLGFDMVCQTASVLVSTPAFVLTVALIAPNIA